jgi:predicted MFS family arabinose efflux permease
VSFWAIALRGTAATFLGIGLARFAFVPLFPAMVAAGWVDGEGAGLLGAMTLAGYLGGALTGQALGRRLGVPGALDAGAALVVLSFLACGWNGGLWWLAAWRAVAGLAGGWLMALAGPAVQAVVPPERRGLASGLVIAGVASGIVVGALAMPWLLRGGPGMAWGVLGLASLLVWAWARRAWPRAVLAPLAGAAGWSPQLTAYVLSGAGMVAPMVYLSDLGVRGHGLALGQGALLWACFGVGALAGTLLGGRAVDAWGGDRSMRIWLWVQVTALAALLSPWDGLLWPGAVAAGFAGVGVSAVTLALVRETHGPASAALWARGTAFYAAAQAGFAFLLAAVFAATGEMHAAVFGIGLLVTLPALLLPPR